MSRVRIVSNGYGYATVVEIDGKPATNVVAVEWQCKAKELATAVVTFDMVEVDVEADVVSEPVGAFEHAPGHRYGVQAGPNGMYARWCLRDDCDWRDTTKPQKDAGLSTVGALLLGLIVIPLLLLAFIVGGQNVICGHGGQQAYCQQAHR